MTLADQLLEAHVAHEMERLRGDRVADEAPGVIDELLAVLGSLTLAEATTAEQVTAVACKYVETFRLPGAIPEIAGEIARRVRNHPANDMLLGDLVQRPRVVELIEVLASMRGLRERALRGLVGSTTLQAGVGGVVHGIATGFLGSGRKMAGRVPGVAQGVTAAEKVAGRVAGGVLEGADQRSRELAEHAAGLLIGYVGQNAATAVSDDELKVALLELWDAMATRPVREVSDALDDDQVVEIVVALYDVWLDLRSSGYVTAMVQSGVEFFYETYSDYRLDRLVEEFGLTREDLTEEALRFAPRVLDALAANGMLEGLLRARFAPFYSSDAARALLG
jgi:hypothetical protein